MGKLNLKRFDPSVIKKDAVILLIGKRGTGKTTLMKDIMYHMRHKLQFGIAMSATEESSGALSTFIQPSCVYNNFCGPALDVMLEYQKQTGRRGGNMRRLFLILDDVCFDKKIMKGMNIRETFMNGRHRKIFFVNCMQYCMDLGPDLRTQVDYVFALRENIMNNREKLHKYFFGMFKDFKDFGTVMDACTQGYECLVLNNTVRSTKVEDCISYYEANPNLPPFKMGAPGFWRLNARYFHDSEDDGHDTIGVAERLGYGAALGPPQRAVEERIHAVIKDDDE